MNQVGCLGLRTTTQEYNNIVEKGNITSLLVAFLQVLLSLVVFLAPCRSCDGGKSLCAISRGRNTRHRNQSRRGIVACVRLLNYGVCGSVGGRSVVPSVPMVMWPCSCSNPCCAVLAQPHLCCIAMRFYGSGCSRGSGLKEFETHSVVMD